MPREPNRTPHGIGVAIVGLGPVGAVLANFLGGRGVPVTIFERDAVPRTEPRAAHLDDDGMRILQAAGVAGAVAAGGRTIDGMEIVDALGRRLLRARKRVDPDAPAGWPAATLVHQPDLERELRAGLERFPSVEVRAGHDVEGIEPDAAGVTLRVRRSDGRYSDRAAWVVGCDGAGSLVRAAIDARMGPPGRPFRERWLVVDTLLRRPIALPLELTQIASARRPTTYVPFAGARRRWEFRLNRHEDPELMTRPAVVAALLQPHVDPSAVEIQRAAVYSFSSAVATRWRRGRLLLAGDAAHLMPPFIGQGLCSGLRDAAFLGWALAAVVRHVATPRLLDAYEIERRPHAAAAVRLSVRTGRFIGAGRSVAAARDVILSAARRLAPVERRLDDVTAGPPTLRSAVAGSGGQPLRLVPQPWVTTSAGERSPLDEVMGPSWAVLGVGLDPQSWVGEDEVWRHLDTRFVRVLTPAEQAPSTLGVRDAEQVLARWAGRSRPSPTAIVVRPDRYLFGMYDAVGSDKAAAELRAALGLATHVREI